MVGCIQPAGGDIVRVLQMQLLCAPIHRVHKARHTSVQPHPGGIGGIVAGRQHHSARQRIQRNQITLGKAHRGALYLNCLCVHLEIFVEIRLLENHHRAHDFGGAGLRQPLVDVFAEICCQTQMKVRFGSVLASMTM